MKLLFDHNLSHKLVRRLEDLFPESSQTRLLNLGRTNDPFLIISDFVRDPERAVLELFD